MVCSRPGGLFLFALLTLAGCDDPVSRKPTASAPAPAPNPTPAPAPAQSGPILGRTTQDIRKMEEEQDRGGRVAPGQVTEKGYVAVVGNSYVVAIDRIAADNIKHAIDLYQAETGEYPKDYDEFMEKIVKANGGIHLPELPHYQKYTYDAKEHKLVIMEYPAEKGHPTAK